MNFTGYITRAAAAIRRWREDQATLVALARLDPPARDELAALVRLRRDQSEYDSKPRSARRPPPLHIDCNGASAHSRGGTR
jgi:hypothetical protein